MNMEIKKEIEKVFQSVTGDKAKIEAFKKDPAGMVKKILGDNLSQELIQKIVEGVKAKLTADTLNDVAGKIGGLFGKK